MQYEKLTNEQLKSQKDKITERYNREVEERITEWKETKEEILDAMLMKEKQRIEDEYQAKQLELEKDRQSKLARLQAFINEEAEEKGI